MDKNDKRKEYAVQRRENNGHHGERRDDNRAYSALGDLPAVQKLQEGGKGMNVEKHDPHITITPRAEVEICENCPYPSPICGASGCQHFKAKKAELLKAKGDNRRLRGKIKNRQGEFYDRTREK